MPTRSIQRTAPNFVAADEAVQDGDWQYRVSSQLSAPRKATNICSTKHSWTAPGWGNASMAKSSRPIV